MPYNNILTFEQFMINGGSSLFENSREKLPSETGKEAETPASKENKDLEDIRFFRGSLKQWNKYLAKKIKENGGEPNPYKNMRYVHPMDREEKESDFITYQDFVNGTSKRSEYLNKTRKSSSADDFRYM